MAEASLFDELGGEPILRKIIDAFVDRVTGDAMIGFFFVGVDRERLKQREYEFAARHLGAGQAYSGRTLREAHARHPIMGGQFMRRLQILKDVLDEAGVPESVKRHWVEHTLSLQAQVTANEGGRCEPQQAAARASRARQGDET
ncbi:MAG: group 1 truncated hemoglobin [Polyangiaceae bacterium]